MSRVPGTSPAFAHSPDRPLPKAADVVVVGGGVVGVTAALTLAERGISVVLCEKGRIAGEQSSRNWGWIRNQRRDPREIPLMLQAQALWRQLAPRLDSDIGLREPGIAVLALSEDEMADHDAWLKETETFQLSSRLLSPAEAGAHVGQAADRFAGGLLTPTDLQAEPARAVPALARLAAETGAAIFEETAIRTLELAGGRVAGVVTEHGRITAPSVLFAGGAWSRTFLENHGKSLPQLAIRSQAMRTAPIKVTAPGPVGTTRAAIRPRLDGGLSIGRSYAGAFDLIPAAVRHGLAFAPHMLRHRRTLKLRLGRDFFGALGRHRWRADQMSPFETARVLDPTPDAGVVAAIQSEARAIFPELADMRIAEVWGGMIDVTPDQIPAIGPIDGLPGLILATGLSGHGFGLGPGAGRLAADLATGHTPIVDPSAFAPSRFRGL